MNRSTSSNPFLEALKIPQDEWVSVIFAWKALLYYDYVTKQAWSRLCNVHGILRELVIRGDQRDVLLLKNRFVCLLDKIHLGASGYIEKAIKQMVSAILAETGAVAMSESLRWLGGRIAAIGTDVTMFEQVTSYFLYLYPTAKMVGVTSEDFMGELCNLCEIMEMSCPARI